MNKNSVIKYLFVTLLSIFAFPTFSQETNILNKTCPIRAENIMVSLLENEDNFSEQEWKSLYKLSEDTFVEETDSLKKGAAGAGLTDND